MGARERQRRLDEPARDAAAALLRPHVQPKDERVARIAARHADAARDTRAVTRDERGVRIAILRTHRREIADDAVPQVRRQRRLVLEQQRVSRSKSASSFTLRTSTTMPSTTTGALMRSARAHVRTRFAAQVALTDRRSALKTRVLKEDEMRLRGWLCVLCVTSLTFLAGCNGGAGLAPSGPVQDGSSSALRAPAVADMSGPESTLSDGSPSRIIRQRFAHPKTPPDEWAWSGTACLTAGNKNTPTTFIPACGASAKKNQSGWGVLQLTDGLRSEYRSSVTTSRS